jgi:ribosomal protein L15E
VAVADAARRGLIPATDIGWVVDLRARREARRHARRHGGAVAAQAMVEYQQAVIELGFLHHRMLRGTAPKDWQVRGRGFVERIQEIRPQLSFPGQVVPQR